MHKNTLFFGLLLGLAVFLRLSSLLNTFLDIDEAQFALFAHSLMDGGLPYVASVDTKPPLIYLFYWACFALFGKYNMVAVHAVTIGWVWATACVIYKIAETGMGKGEACFAPTRTARMAALFYVVFSTCFLPKFISTSITLIMMLPICLSVWCWIKNKPVYFLSGIFTGLAFLFKYQAGIQILVFAGWLLLAVIQGRQKIIPAVRTYFLFLLGFILPILLMVLTFQHLRIWDEFVFWSVKGSALYIQGGHHAADFAFKLGMRGGGFILATLLLWVLASKTPLSLALSHKGRGNTLLLSLWLLLSWIPVMTGGRFYGHYFIQLLPPLCLLAAQNWPDKPPHWMWAGILIPTFFFWMLRLDFPWIEKHFPDNNLVEQEHLGNWIKDNTPPDSPIFVWGYASAVYFDAQRQPATRFLWSDWFTGLQSNSKEYPQVWADLLQDLGNHPPALIADTATCNIHNYARFPLQNYPELWNWVQSRYEYWTTVEGCTIYKSRRGE